MTVTNSSLGRQAWTIITGGKKKILRTPFLSVFTLLLFFSLQNVSCTLRNKKPQMHKCHMSCFLFLYFLFQDLNTTVPRLAAPKPQFPGSPLPPRCCLIGGSRTTHRMVHTEASCDWLRWYSTESDLLSKITISQVGFFCLFVGLNVMHFSSSTQTPPSPAVQQ